jgi:hypothetical protein
LKSGSFEVDWYKGMLRKCINVARYIVVCGGG